MPFKKFYIYWVRDLILLFFFFCPYHCSYMVCSYMLLCMLGWISQKTDYEIED